MQKTCPGKSFHVKLPAGFGFRKFVMAFPRNLFRAWFRQVEIKFCKAWF